MNEVMLIQLIVLIGGGAAISYAIIMENGYFGAGIHENICKFTNEARNSKWEIDVNNSSFVGHSELSISTAKYKLEVKQSNDFIYDISFFSHDRQNIINLTVYEDLYLQRFAKRSLPKFHRLYLDE